MTKLDSILKSRDITLPTKVHLVKAMVFPVVFAVQKTLNLQSCLLSLLLHLPEDTHLKKYCQHCCQIADCLCFLLQVLWFQVLHSGINTFESIFVYGVKKWSRLIFAHVHFSCSVMCNSLRPQRLLHTRLPCPSPTPRACSNSCPLSW